MRILPLAIIVTVPLMLSACVNAGTFGMGPHGYDARFDRYNDEPGQLESSIARGSIAGQPQSGGWYTSSATRKAERKSIARDMPYAVVKPSGTVIYR